MIEHIRYVCCCLHTHEPHDLGVQLRQDQEERHSGPCHITKTVDEGFDRPEGPFVEDEAFGQNVYYIFQGVRNINIAEKQGYARLGTVDILGLSNITFSIVL